MKTLLLAAVIPALLVQTAFAQDLGEIFEKQKQERSAKALEAYNKATKEAEERMARQKLAAEPYLNNPGKLEYDLIVARLMQVLAKEIGNEEVKATQLELVEVDPQEVIHKDCVKIIVPKYAIRGYVQLNTGLVYKVDFSPQQHVERWDINNRNSMIRVLDNDVIKIDDYPRDYAARDFLYSAPINQDAVRYLKKQAMRIALDLFDHATRTNLPIEKMMGEVRVPICMTAYKLDLEP